MSEFAAQGIIAADNLRVFLAGPAERPSSGVEGNDWPHRDLGALVGGMVIFGPQLTEPKMCRLSGRLGRFGSNCPRIECDQPKRYLYFLSVYWHHADSQLRERLQMEARILRRREVERLTQLSKASIYRQMQLGTFPDAGEARAAGSRMARGRDSRVDRKSPACDGRPAPKRTRVLIFVSQADRGTADTLRFLFGWQLAQQFRGARLSLIAMGETNRPDPRPTTGDSRKDSCRCAAGTRLNDSRPIWNQRRTETSTRISGRR